MGSAIAFSIYELLKHPDHQEQIVAEADALFTDGEPTAADVSPEAADASRRFIMEVLRLHEVVPMHLRTAMNAFEIGGIEVPAASTLLISFSAPHHMKEHFPEVRCPRTASTGSSGSAWSVTGSRSNPRRTTASRRDQQIPSL
ncbi:MAG: cytochrome P450 [Holophagales bacterium]|nr:cytochrome P450 [Holophagales bacterium]